MVFDEFDAAELSQLFPNVVSMLIMGASTVALLALSPWGFDPLRSSLTHFFTLWPLLLLAILTYVAMVKLADEDRVVPNW